MINHSLRSKSRLGADGRVITDAKSSSALGPLYGWRRVLRDGGAQLPKLGMIKPIMKGLVQQFKDKFGSRAMVPTRKKPFSRPHLLRIAATLKARAMPNWNDAKHDGLDVAYKYGLSTGVRADEPTHPKDFTRRDI